MFFTDKKRKKNLLFTLLALPLFCGVVFLAQTHVVHADVIADAFDLVFKGILLGVFTMLGWLTSVAVTLFEWAIKSENISGGQGLLTQPAIYEMWKFIRDFFNLFFILVLLYIAFTVIFQISKDFKKALLSLVLAALFVNFSFPVSRALIDAANVPMYFFANQMMAANGKSPGEGGGYSSVFSSALSASQLKGILIPGAENNGSTKILDNSYGRYLVAIIFMFLFSVTLLVLAVMFVIRLVALVILVIFSSVGFVAYIIPGMGSYSKMWWDYFWKYAIFGPAAMLMLLIATHFLSALGDTKTGVFKNLTSTATSVVSSDPTFFASMAMFSVPIIMLWFAMGLAQKMSLAGATSVVGWGQKASKWAGKAPFRAGWAGLKFADRKIEKKAAERGMWTPRSVVKAWQDRSVERKKKDQEPIDRVAGVVQDKMNKTISGDHTNHAFEVKQHQAAARAKELLDVSQNSSYLINELNAAYKSGDAVEIEGATMALLKTNNLNDLMEASLNQGYGKNLDKISAADSVDGQEHVKINSVNAGKIVDNLLSQAGFKDGTDEMALEGTALSEIALAAGNGTLFGRYSFDKGHWKKNKDADQAKAVAGKFRNLESQERQKKSHPDNAFDYYIDKDGTRHVTDLNGEVGVAFMGTYTGADVDESKRSRDDFKTGMPELKDMITSKKVPKYLEQALKAANKEILNEYIDKVTTMVRGKGVPTGGGTPGAPTPFSQATGIPPLNNP